MTVLSQDDISVFRKMILIYLMRRSRADGLNWVR